MKDRVAFVTGAARGLGHATVRTLLEAGWDVFFTYGSSVEQATRLCDIGRQLGRRVECLSVNLLRQSEVLHAASVCVEQLGQVDALVHNFGPFVFDRVPLADYSDDMWDRMMTGNLHNFFWMYRFFAPGMRRNGFGRIVTIGCDGATVAAGWRMRGAYAAAKSGLASLTRTIAREERQNGITANMVCPGDIRGAAKMRMIRETPHPEDRVSREAVGEDVARLITFLCDPYSSQLNGTVTEVTGGFEIRARDSREAGAQAQPALVSGQRVWVIPWQRRGVIAAVVCEPDKDPAYRVVADDWQGTFSLPQLSLSSENGG